MSTWTTIATFDTYEKAREYLDNLPKDTNDNFIKEFKIKRYHDKFTVRSRYETSLAGTVEDLHNTLKRLEKSASKRKKN